MNDLLKFEIIDLSELADSSGGFQNPDVPACGGCGGNRGKCPGGGCGGDNGKCYA